MNVDVYELDREATEAVRRSTRLKNVKSANTMVETHRAKNPLSMYAVGEEVLLRNVGKDKRVLRGGRKITSCKALQGTVVEFDADHFKYKIDVDGTPRWYQVKDITSLTRDKELQKKAKAGEPPNDTEF